MRNQRLIVGDLELKFRHSFLSVKRDGCEVIKPPVRYREYSPDSLVNFLKKIDLQLANHFQAAWVGDFFGEFTRETSYYYLLLNNIGLITMYNGYYSNQQRSQVEIRYALPQDSPFTMIEESRVMLYEQKFWQEVVRRRASDNASVYVPN